MTESMIWTVYRWRSAGGHGIQVAGARGRDKAGQAIRCRSLELGNFLLQYTFIAQCCPPLS